MDDSYATRGWAAGAAAGDRPGFPLTGLIGLALIPVVVSLAVVAGMLLYAA